MEPETDAFCYVGEQTIDSIVLKDPCPCADHDYEWYVLSTDGLSKQWRLEKLWSRAYRHW